MRVISKIETIVREEMDSHGGQEILMPFVQPAELCIAQAAGTFTAPSFAA